MKIAYVMNQHPNLSCTFIRREIVGLEASGLRVTRFAARHSPIEPIDEADKKELRETRYILASGLPTLLTNFLVVLLTNPIKFLIAFRQAIRLGLKSSRGILFHIAYLVEACTLLRWLHQSPVDHLHAHFATNSTTVAMLCNTLGGPPYSFTVHGPEEFDNVESQAITEKIVQALFVLAVSSFGKSQLFRWCSHRHWSKLHELHCGVDKFFLEGVYEPPPNQRQLVCVGRLAEQKGHFLLLEAVSLLVQEGFIFKLLLVGDGSLRSELETLIEDRGLQACVEITGWATNQEVQQFIKASQVLVQPSFAEGLPVVIMESLALGRPVLSTYIAGIPELVRSGVNGWLVPAGSTDALAEAMRTVLKTPLSELEKMGKAGMGIVAERHNALNEASKLATILREAHAND